MSVRGGRVRAYVQLLRPANVVTAWADVLAGAAAGYAVAGMAAEGAVAALAGDVALLVLATSGLYGGGVVLNDVFDAALDAVERPERPIPSGRASRRGAAAFGAALLAAGVLAAALVNTAAMFVALSVAALVLVYDGWAKHHAALGPLTMGACRGGNLLLGGAVAASALPELGVLTAIPVVYIAAITLVSRGEVHGGGQAVGWGSVAALGLVAAGVLALGAGFPFSALVALPFLALWGARVLPAFVRAARRPSPEPIRQAVRAGVTSLILLDAALAAGFGGWLVGGAVLLLAPLAAVLARTFAVT